MKLIEKLINFLKKFWLFSNSETEEIPDENEESADSVDGAEEPSIEQLEEAANEAESTVIDDRVKVVQMTLTRLYMLSQKITIFEESFPDNYLLFKSKIDELEKNYNDSLNAMKENLTFEIDPEQDGEKLAKILKLEKDVEAFIEKEVKFDIIIKKIQRLIVKLNILYNVSMTHTRLDEKNKAVIQTKRAVNAENRIIKEFKHCEYLVGDMRLKEKIVGFVSYLDYLIFKLLLRNSDITPNEVINELAISVEFEGINCNAVFEAFLEDELSDLVKLIEQIQNNECKKMLESDYKELYTHLIGNEHNLINFDFWNSVFNLESTVLSVLKESGIEKDSIKIKLISRMNIQLTENDVLVSPKTNTYLALVGIFSKTKDSRITLVLKLLKNVSDEVTYKEIYFVLLLFDVLDIVESTPNELADDLERYLKKYPYSASEINQKKKLVLNSSNSEYIYVFTIDEYEQNLLKTLEQLRLDFKNIENKIFLNAIYFSGLTTVINSLKATNND